MHFYIYLGVSVEYSKKKNTFRKIILDSGRFNIRVGQ